MKDKIVIVTGASSGIGKALAFQFGHFGSKVVVAARNEAKLEKVADQLRSEGIQVLAVKTDVSNEDECRHLINRTVEHFGGIDVLINNAGISMRALFGELELPVMKCLMDVNFWGTVYCTKYALPYLLKAKGSVAGIISIAGYVGLPGRTGYSASKFAVRGFLDTLRIENLYSGLHVLVAAPGFTASNVRYSALTADGSLQGSSPRNETGMMSAEAVAHKIYKAILKRKRSIVLTLIEGKLTVFLAKWFPAWIDKLTFSHMEKEQDSPFSKKMIPNKE